MQKPPRDRLNYRAAHFLTSAIRLNQCPPDQGWEVAFAGRSNAGKSSAINSLTGNRKLARTSKTPGRTQLLNFFSLGDTVHLYQQLMTLWFDCSELLDLNFHTVRYESLVSDTEAELQKLFAFLEIDWDESVLDFHQRAAEKDIINTPSYEQVTRPIYAEARYRWHRYRQQLEPFLEELEPFSRKLGYPEGA